MKQTKKPEEQKKPTPPAPDPVESQGFDWSQEAQTGFEGTRPEDLGIPFLVILQDGSPQVKRTHPDYETKKIEGAESGHIINTLTNEILYAGDDENPLLFVPVFHERLWQEWKTREEGGGFIQSHKSPVILTETKRDAKKRDILPNGNQISTTSYFQGVIIKEGEEPTKAIIGMTSTQLKKARQWLNLAQSIKLGGRIPPLYSHIYSLTTVPESNEQGSWWGWKIEINRVLTNADISIIDEARKLSSAAAETGRLLTLPAGEQESLPAPGEEKPF